MNIKIDNISIIKPLGEGGTSMVYLAYDTKTKRQVTLKVLKDNAGQVAEESFLNEADILRQIKDRRAPKLIREGKGYLEISFIPGESLFKLLKRSGKLSEKRALLYGKDIIAILRMLHERNRPIIYRDLKPSNIIVEEDGHATLIDYGAARIYRDDGTADTTNLGTGGYAAPEQYGYLGQTNQQTDIYAFGMTLLQMMTGMDVKDSRAIENVKESGIRGISDKTTRLIDMCIKPGRNNRFKNCKEVETALNKSIRALKWRKPIMVFKLAVAAMVMSVIISVGIIYSGEIASYVRCDAELRLPEVKNRLGNARVRIQEVIDELVVEEKR